MSKLSVKRDRLMSQIQKDMILGGKKTISLILNLDMERHAKNDVYIFRSKTTSLILR